MPGCPLPEVEHIVQRVVFLAACAVVGGADYFVNAFHERASAHLFAADIDGSETAVGVQGDGGVVEQEAVAHEEEGAVLVEAPQVALHLLGHSE